jgi:pimeloyl-ACP methyl ester carboxylesterase
MPLATSGTAIDEAHVVVCHATGFCKETLSPLIVEAEKLAGPLHATLVDGRGHGASTPHPGPFDWHSATIDIVDMLAGRSAPIVGVGHSWGGAILARAEILRPGTFSHLVLIEPSILPPPYAARDIPLSLAAERRRSSFPSRDAAYRRFATGPFATWDPRALAGYVDHGFVQTGDGWTLRCKREVEAEVFRQGSNVDTWDRLGEVDLPVVIVAGEHSTTHGGQNLDDLTGRFPHAQAAVIEGFGHLVPMESPRSVAAIGAAVVGSR